MSTVADSAGKFYVGYSSCLYTRYTWYLLQFRDDIRTDPLHIAFRNTDRFDDWDRFVLVMEGPYDKAEAYPPDTVLHVRESLAIASSDILDPIGLNSNVFYRSFVKRNVLDMALDAAFSKSSIFSTPCGSSGIKNLLPNEFITLCSIRR